MYVATHFSSWLGNSWSTHYFSQQQHDDECLIDQCYWFQPRIVRRKHVCYIAKWFGMFVNNVTMKPESQAIEILRTRFWFLHKHLQVNSFWTYENAIGNNDIIRSRWRQTDGHHIDWIEQGNHGHISVVFFCVKLPFRMDLDIHQINVLATDSDGDLYICCVHKAIMVRFGEQTVSRCLN